MFAPTDAIRRDDAPTGSDHDFVAGILGGFENMPGDAHPGCFATVGLHFRAPKQECRAAAAHCQQESAVRT